MYRKSLQDIMEVDEAGQTPFLWRVGSLPLVASTVDQVTLLYGKTKDYNSLMKYTLEVAETGVSKVSKTAKPFVTKFEKPIEVANILACQQLDKLEKQYPIIAKPTEQVLEQSKVYYDQTVKPWVDPVIDMPTTIKDYSTQKVMNMKTYTVESIGATKSYACEKVNQAATSPYGKLVTKQVDTLLDTIEPYVDQYLPEKGDEPEKEVASAEEASTLNRVACLSDKVRRRMYSKAMTDLGNIQLRTKETVDNLNFTVDLIQYARNNIDGVQENLVAAKSKVSSLWTEINKSDEELAKEREAEGVESDETLERRVISTARHLTQKLRSGAASVTNSVTYLPAPIQTRLQELNKLADSLYHFQGVSSFKEIPQVALNQTRQQIAYINETVASLGVFLSELRTYGWAMPEYDFNDLDMGEPDTPENGVLQYVPYDPRDDLARDRLEHANNNHN